MSEYRRWRIEGGAYFFTCVTYRRRQFLTTATSRRCLREAFRRVRINRPFKIVSIVLLPDHFHTVWELPVGDADYSTRWRQLKTLFTRLYSSHLPCGAATTASRLKRREHPVWQRRFYEHTCRDEADLKRCVDYVHANPVKHKLVQRVCDWRWSSFHRYVKLGEYEIDWGGGEWFGDEFRWAE
jgi:putative transposase